MATEANAGQALQHDTEAKVAFLRQPRAYPDLPDVVDVVDVVETHTSWIFLSGRRVYKFKKPLRYDYLDFSTLEARRRNCIAEVRLNSRLSPEVYLGVVPLTVDEGGEMALGGAGETVEWLVQMRRLPRDQALEFRLKQGAVTETHVAEVARKLADFYERTAPVPMDVSDYRDRFHTDIQDNLEALIAPQLQLSRSRLERIARRQQAFLRDHFDLFAQRVRKGRIKEAHGDLRPEHIYLGPHGPKIIDCLEFSRELRILDCVDELAFLAMECERLGAPCVKGILFSTYRQIAEDDPAPKLVHFYMSYRASLWARLAILHVIRQGKVHHRKWIERTLDYLRLAEAHIEQAGGKATPAR